MAKKKVKEVVETVDTELAGEVEEGVSTSASPTKDYELKRSGVDKMYRFFKFTYELTSPMLGSCANVGIHKTWLIDKARRNIKAADNAQGKLIKSLEKYRGSDIGVRKEMAELKGMLRDMMIRVAKHDSKLASSPIPDTIEEILALGDTIAEVLDKSASGDEDKGITVFMKNKDGHAVISTHVFLGNWKDSMKKLAGIVPKGTYPVQTKVGVGETMSVAVKPVEFLIKPSQDIMRLDDGTADLCERPIIFPSRKKSGENETAVARSEQLPIGTVLVFHARILRASPVITMLYDLVDMGQNNGLGPWRGSGMKGTYLGTIEEVDAEYIKSLPSGYEMMD